jgi:ribonuclease III
MNQTKGHPKGLYLLFVTEMWERFSYYGMRALFMLYMVQALLFDKEMASQVYGSYTGLVYLTPLIGGYIADRYWGNRRSIVVGALTMALGQFLLFLSACYFQEVALAKYLMFCGLGLLILGNGFFKPNISTMVGRLYTPDDNRKDSAFTIFYMGVNVGSTLAPLVCGLVGNTGHPEDFKWGFLAACIGMILGATVFQIFKNKYICDPDGNPVGVAPQRSASTAQQSETSSQKSTSRTLLMLGSTLLLTLLFSINWNADSVLQIVSADYLFHAYADRPEGDLTRIRASLVSESALFQFAQEIDLGEYLRLGRGEERCGGRTRPSVVSDAFEALIAALYLDGGMDVARSFILPFITEGKHAEADYKTRLQEIVQQNPEERLSYVVESESGPDHDKHFVVAVRFNSDRVARGEGRSKKAAEQCAAKEALKLLGVIKEK